MNRNPDEVFVGEIGVCIDDDNGEEALNLHYDLHTFDFVVVATDLSSCRETTYGVRAFLSRVPEAASTVRQLILEKFHPERARRECWDLGVAPNIELSASSGPCRPLHPAVAAPCGTRVPRSRPGTP